MSLMFFLKGERWIKLPAPSQGEVCVCVQVCTWESVLLRGREVGESPRRADGSGGVRLGDPKPRRFTRLLWAPGLIKHGGS